MAHSYMNKSSKFPLRSTGGVPRPGQVATTADPAYLLYAPTIVTATQINAYSIAPWFPLRRRGIKRSDVTELYPLPETHKRFGFGTSISTLLRKSQGCPVEAENSESWSCLAGYIYHITVIWPVIDANEKDLVPERLGKSRGGVVFALQQPSVLSDGQI